MKGSAQDHGFFLRVMLEVPDAVIYRSLLRTRPEKDVLVEVFDEVGKRPSIREADVPFM
jgi:hypothetical protein